MGLKKLRVQAKAKPARGAKDAAVCVELCEHNWSEIQDAFQACSEEEQNELFEHFNGAVDGVGDVLFGEDQQDFKSKMEGLNDEEQKAFVKALRESELIEDLNE